MAEIDDRDDVAPLQISAKVNRRRPSRIAPGREGRVQGRAVAEEPGCRGPSRSSKSVLPVLVMAALLHLVDAGAAIVDGRNAVLDAGREHEAASNILRFRLARAGSGGASGPPARGNAERSAEVAEARCRGPSLRPMRRSRQIWRSPGRRPPADPAVCRLHPARRAAPGCRPRGALRP